MVSFLCTISHYSVICQWYLICCLHYFNVFYYSWITIFLTKIDLQCWKLKHFFKKVEAKATSNTLSGILLSLIHLLLLLWSFLWCDSIAVMMNYTLTVRVKCLFHPSIILFLIQVTAILVQRKTEIGSCYLDNCFKDIERQDILRHIFSIKESVQQILHLSWTRRQC